VADADRVMPPKQTYVNSIPSQIVGLKNSENFPVAPRSVIIDTIAPAKKRLTQRREGAKVLDDLRTTTCTTSTTKK
jgi:hypothetical protein